VAPRSVNQARFLLVDESSRLDAVAGLLHALDVGTNVRMLADRVQQRIDATARGSTGEPRGRSGVRFLDDTQTVRRFVEDQTRTNALAEACAIVLGEGDDEAIHPPRNVHITDSLPSGRSSRQRFALVPQNEIRSLACAVVEHLVSVEPLELAA